MRILLAGGGTGGPSVPLFAVQQHLKKTHPHAMFLFVGANSGPERAFAEKYAVPFISIPSGKLRRYFSLRNLTAPFEVLFGFFKAYSILKKFDPDVVFAAGGYISVPIVLAAFFQKRKILIHQQDVEPTLSNKILAPFATKITVTFEQSMKFFSSGSGFFRQKEEKVIWTGNPYREELLNAELDAKAVRAKFNIVDELPVILVFGGATGALGLNKIIEGALLELTRFAHVIHATGAGKGIDFKHHLYHQYALIPNMDEAYKIADIVICRAGLSTITELSTLKKVAIVVPMPDSHQLYNAEALAEQHAAIVFNQKLLTPELLVKEVRTLTYDGQRQNLLKESIYTIMPKNSTEKIANIILDLCHKEKK